jgi:wobble nucleotide-excising tRNase
MLYKILRVKNVGLFADGVLSDPIVLNTVTLFYAENGRGKSTLSSVLRACALGDPGRVNARKTVDSTEMPEVSLLFRLANGTKQISFADGSWNATHPDIMVFDSNFVEQNVYSGFEVRSDQRQSLLEFALGDDAVELKNCITDLTKAIDAATRRRSDSEKQLSGYLGPYKLATFLALPADDTIEERLSNQESRIEAAKRAAQLMLRQDPKPLPLIDFDLDCAINTLSKRLADLEQHAEEIIRNHLEHHVDSEIENWISSGQPFMDSDTCPFCGRPLAGLELIKAYQSYFNQEYQELKAEVVSLGEAIKAGFGSQQCDSLVSAAATNTARVDAWKDLFALAVPDLADVAIQEGLDRICRCLLSLVESKRAQPLERSGTDAVYQWLKVELASVNFHIAEYNRGIAEMVGAIQAYKIGLGKENIEQIQTDLKRLEAVKRRYQPGVIALVSAYLFAEDERKRLDAEKTLIRQQLDGLMHETLSQYQGRVNELLGQFNAAFRIEQLKPNYKGTGEPRTDYGLSVRNQLIKLGSRDDMATTHSFGSSLSEADKRTLAFAFFIARLERNPRLKECIVVLDDPVSSLDLNRRRASIRLIAKTSKECRQVITLSHDAHFVRDLRDEVQNVQQGANNIVLYSIGRTTNDYSVLESCDIDGVCASSYYRNYKLVEDFVNGTSKANSRDVAIAIRLMLEGYYHRRFPGILPKNLMFGRVIEQIAQATAPSPLVNLQPHIGELREVNEYASNFHHDTNPEASFAVINETELLGWSRRAMNLVYK